MNSIHVVGRLPSRPFLFQISRWIKTADVARLEHAVYMGKGAHMRGREAIQ